MHAAQREWQERETEKYEMHTPIKKAVKNNSLCGKYFDNGLIRDKLNFFFLSCLREILLLVKKKSKSDKCLTVIQEGLLNFFSLGTAMI